MVRLYEAKYFFLFDRFAVALELIKQYGCPLKKELAQIFFCGLARNGVYLAAIVLKILLHQFLYLEDKKTRNRPGFMMM